VALFVWMRRAWQVLFLGLFLFLFLVTTSRSIRGWPVEWFLWLDPLAAVTTALATWTLPGPMLWAVALVLLTLLLGRFFCGWVCPLGVLQHAVGWLGRPRRVVERFPRNAPAPSQRVKYVILVVMLGMAGAGSVQVGLLDPIATLWRALATSVVPAASNTAWGLYQGERHFQWGTVIALLFVVTLAMSLYRPRWFCRVVCPLGALLGWFSRFSLFRLARTADACTGCGTCAADCQGAANPDGQVLGSECMLCLNCTTGCKQGALAYTFLPAPGTTRDGVDLSRRRAAQALAAGVVAVPLARASDGVGPRPHPLRIRPPGAVDEEEFLGRCLKCGACMKVCPTGGLQPALVEAGWEGLWTPVLVPRLGHCEHACVLCSHVCPTRAIAPLTVEQKVGTPTVHEAVRIGSAAIDRGRCLPWANDTPCIVCEEVCPTSPKAIHYKVVEVKTRDGSVKRLQQPVVDLTLCVGCGTCEARCPVFDLPAIRVTSVGETRSPRNRVILGGRV
jgi:polyferredoxin